VLLLLYPLLLYTVLMPLLLLTQHGVSQLHCLLHFGFPHSNWARWIHCWI
jgi:hypothetical protein